MSDEGGEVSSSETEVSSVGGNDSENVECHFLRDINDSETEEEIEDDGKNNLRNKVYLFLCILDSITALFVFIITYLDMKMYL